MSDTSQSTSFAETRDILSSTDYLLEPEIFKTLPKYVRLGGFPEEAIRLLSQNYRGYPQMCNLVVSWLKLCGKSEDDIKNIQEVYLRDLALNQFDPEIADNAFIHREATPDWLEQMTKLSRWRSLLCELSEKYPNCMLLNFAIRKISDAGYQSEIATITSASAYIDVFNRVLLDKLRYILTEQNDEKFESAIKDFAKLGYLLEYISHTVKGAAKQLSRNVDRLHLILTGTARYPAVALALVSILSSGRLAPSDVDHLYSQYSSDDPPPISLVRLPELFELFIKLLFNHNKPLSNSSHKSKYIYVLALMGSVCQNNDRVDLERTTKALETVIAVCMKNDVRYQSNYEISVLVGEMWCPVVCAGLIHWIGLNLEEPGYFQMEYAMSGTVPIHLALLDQIASRHSPLHGKIFRLLVAAMAIETRLEVLLAMNLKRIVIDRMLHLVVLGYVSRVLGHWQALARAQSVEPSLLRYFVCEFIRMIAPPFHARVVAAIVDISKHYEMALENEESVVLLREFFSKCSEKDLSPSEYQQLTDQRRRVQTNVKMVC